MMTKTISHPPSTSSEINRGLVLAKVNIWPADLSKLKLPSSINCLTKDLKEWVALRLVVVLNCRAFSNQAENKLLEELPASATVFMLNNSIQERTSKVVSTSDKKRLKLLISPKNLYTLSLIILLIFNRQESI